jgi:hypothetical protein
MFDVGTLLASAETSAALARTPFPRAVRRHNPD